MGTILVIKVSPESADQFGELVADPNSNELLHYTEKPETFVRVVDQSQQLDMLNRLISYYYFVLINNKCNLHRLVTE